MKWLTVFILPFGYTRIMSGEYIMSSQGSPHKVISINVHCLDIAILN